MGYTGDDYDYIQEYGLNQGYGAPMARGAIFIDDYDYDNDQDDRNFLDVNLYPNEVVLKNAEMDSSKLSKKEAKKEAKSEPENDFFFCFGKGCQSKNEEQPVIQINSSKRKQPLPTVASMPQNIEDHRQLIKDVLASRAAMKATEASKIEGVS